MIFIVGNSRSGTTMLGRILGANTGIHTFEELHFFEQIVDAAAIRERPNWSDAACTGLIERLLTSARSNIFATPVPGAFAPEVATILKDCAARDPLSIYRAVLAHETGAAGKRIACEQTPRYLFFAPEILAALPEAKIINMTRDPRDILLSQKNKWRVYFHGHWKMPLGEAIRAWMNYHPLIIAKLWVGAVRAAARLKDHPNVISLRFEDLAAHPEREMRRVCAHVGVTFEADMLKVTRIGSSEKSVQPQATGIDNRRVGSWKSGGLSGFEVALCEQVAWREMAGLGYTPQSDRLPGLRLFPSLILLGFKGFGALLMNLSRTRNLRDTLRRRLGV